jgi:PAS domain S-box-containing protein
MSETPEPVAGLEARYAALRQAARSEGGEPGDVLEAAFSELEGAIELLRAAAPDSRGEPVGVPADNAERGLLRAVFQDAPVPLFLLTRDGTVQRVNRAAGDVIGAKPGYATGRPFTVFVAMPSRAAVNSQLTAVGRTGKPRQIRCSLVAGDGLVPCELVIGRVGVKGNPGESDPLVVAVRDVPAVPVPDAETPDVKTTAKPQLGAVQAITRRLDLVTAVARLLLENEGYSESRTLQRCARLIARELTAWVIVDMDRRHRVRRQFVAGPDDPRLTELTSALAAVDPPPGSVPYTVQESGHPALVAHADDAAALGQDVAGEQLLTRLEATSLLSVPGTGTSSWPTWPWCRNSASRWAWPSASTGCSAAAPIRPTRCTPACSRGDGRTSPACRSP